MNIFENITAIPAITVIVLVFAQAIKSWTPLNTKHIPAMCGVLGAVLGVICVLWLPGFLPAENALVGAAIGAVSGWAATGANQVVKQYLGGNENE